ncbi:SUN domain-containing protein 2-like [Engraulis encrasicolus]|uniref:SUN domain-containing protein 2-like n=1 Tax=Engraulis encrasicolus TaxID=184585 RepID=UPI002FD68DE0
MSRRSHRLLTSGYYRNDGEISEEDKYRESRVRNGHTHRRRRAQSHGSWSSTSFSPEDSVDFSGVADALRATLRTSSDASRPPSAVSPCGPSVSSGIVTPVSPRSPSRLEQSTSGYSSAEELDHTWRRRSRQPNKNQHQDSELAAGLHLARCTFLDLLKGVLLLISKSFRNTALTLLALTFLTTCTGFWCRFPAPSSHKLNAESTHIAQKFDMDPKVAADLRALREELVERINQENARWMETWTRELDDAKRDINLLKKNGRKHQHASERLQTDMAILNDVAKNNYLQTEVTGQITVMSENIAELKNRLSHLREDHHYIRQHIAKQEDSNAIYAEMKKELTDWLKHQLRAQFGQRDATVLHRDLQGALEVLEERLLQGLPEEEHGRQDHVWGIVAEVLQREGLGYITVKDVHEIVQRVSSLYKEDGTGMADYAMESLGARVIESRCSETHQTRPSCTSLFGIPLWRCDGSESPRTVIQPEVHPGKCWAFKGSEGFVTIALSLSVRVTHVSLEHIPRSLSPTGRIDSAPRDFVVYGLRGIDEQEEGDILGRFTYDSEGQPIQTFQLPDSAKDVYHAVQLRVLSNWGNPTYTCVYRIRVHGHTPAD